MKNKLKLKLVLEFDGEIPNVKISELMNNVADGIETKIINNGIVPDGVKVYTTKFKVVMGNWEVKRKLI